MCLSEDQQHLHCDGQDCDARTAIPVALRSTLQAQPPHAADGWLFVVGTGVSLHFCPHCALRQLERQDTRPSRVLPSSS